jgi:hypothetical protein
VARSSSRTTSGIGIQESRRGRFGSLSVTAWAIDAPIRSITTPQ